MTETNGNHPNDTGDKLSEVLAQLTTDQMRFVIARNEYSTDKDAAEAIDFSAATIKRWKMNGASIDEAVRLMAYDGIIMASELRRRNLAKAMAVKVAGLDNDSDVIAQKVATEIIEGEMGKAAQTVKTELSGEITTSVDSDQYDKALSFLAKTLGGSLPREGDEQDGEMGSGE